MLLDERFNRMRIGNRIFESRAKMLIDERLNRKQILVSVGLKMPLDERLKDTHQRRPQDAP